MTKGKPQTTKNNTAQENLTERLERKETVRGTALTITGGFLWGIAGVFGKYTFEYKGVTATWIVNVRLIIAGIILLTRAYMVQKDGIFRIWKNKRHVLRMLVYGVIGIAGCQMTYYLAVEDSNAGIATVLQYTAPVMIMVLLALKNWKLPGKNEILEGVLNVADDDIIERLYALLQGESVIARIDQNVVYKSLSEDPANIYSLLLVAGYLKTGKKELLDDGTYLCEVSIPNKEIAAVYRSEVLFHLLQIGAITRTTANKIAEESENSNRQMRRKDREITDKAEMIEILK